MENFLSERVARRFVASQGQQEALRVLNKVERFLGAYEKAAKKVEEAAKKADSPEKGFLDGSALDFKPLSKFSQVARNLGQDDLEDLYYDTEGSLNDRARNTYSVLKHNILLVFSGKHPPQVATALEGCRSAEGTKLLSVKSVDKWLKATQKWLKDTRKALDNAERATKKKSNWK